jgi:NitT/TauT family transport system substrate-binding protein
VRRTFPSSFYHAIFLYLLFSLIYHEAFMTLSKPIHATFGLLACLIAGFLAGCDNSSAPASSTTKPSAPQASGPDAVKIALNWLPEPQFGGWYQAQANGDYAKNNLNVTIVKGGSGAPTIQTVSAGTFEFAVTSGEEVLIQQQNGLDVVALFALYQTSPRAIMTSKERGLKSLQEVFKSGTLIVEPGSTFLKFLDKKFGLDKVKQVPYSGGVAYLNGPDYAQQCFFTSEPVSARAMGKDPQVFLVSEAGYNPYMSVLVCRREYLEKNRDLVTRFVKATREGWTSYEADPTKANQVMAKEREPNAAETKFKEFQEVAGLEKQLILNDATKEKGIGMMTDEDWTRTAKQLLDLGIIKSIPDVKKLYVDLK